MGNVERLTRAEKVAVLLNANARNVSEGLKRELENFVPPEDLYYSRSFEDARSIASTVLDKGYRTVLTGGGDGTFVGYVNCLFEEARRPVATASERRVQAGALARAHGQAAPLRRAQAGDRQRRGRLRRRQRPPRRRGRGHPPRPLRRGLRRRAPCTCSRTRASARPSPAWASTRALLNDYVGHEGAGGPRRARVLLLHRRQDPSRLRACARRPQRGGGEPGRAARSGLAPTATCRPRILRGEVIYKGPCKIAAAGTVPNYGFGFRIFPYACARRGASSSASPPSACRASSPTCAPLEGRTAARRRARLPLREGAHPLRPRDAASRSAATPRATAAR